MRRRRTSPVVQIVGLPNPWLSHSRPERPQVADRTRFRTGHMDALILTYGVSAESFKQKKRQGFRELFDWLRSPRSFRFVQANADPKKGSALHAPQC